MGFDKEKGIFVMDGNPQDLSINPTHLYRLDNITTLTGLGTNALRKLRRTRGLVVHYAGTRGFILGADIISAITSNPTPPLS